MAATLLESAERKEAWALQILSTRKLLFMPVANPDGCAPSLYGSFLIRQPPSSFGRYAWNHQHRPKGGGMKRKNGLRTCSRGAGATTEYDGVDLNRNFG